MAGDGVVRNLMVVFGVKVKNLFQAERLQDGVNAIEQGLQSLNSIAIKAAATLGVLGAGLVTATKPVAELASESDRFAKAFGISVEKMQGMGFGMRALGADADDLSDVLLQISEKARQVSTGSKEATLAFNDLGMSAAEIKNMTPVELFERMTDGFRGLTNQQTKFALASQLLGEDLAKKLLPTITQGGMTLADFAKIAQDAGAIMDESQVETGKRMSLTYKKLGAVVQALKIRIGLELMPYVDRIGNKMWDWYQANKAVVNSKIAEYVKEIGDSMEWVKGTAFSIKALVDRMGGMEAVAKKLAAVFAAGVGIKVVVALVSILSGAFTVLSAITLQAAGLFILAAVHVGTFTSAIALLADDFAVAQRGGESFIEYLRSNLDKLPTSFGAIVLAVDLLKVGFDVLSGFFRAVITEAEIWIDILRPFLPYFIASVLVLGGLLIGGILAPFLAFVGVTFVLVKAIRVLGTVAVAVGQAIVSAFGVLVEEVFSPLYDAIVGGVVSVGAAVWGFLSNLVLNVAGMIHALFTSAVDPVGDWFEAFFTGLENGIAGFINGILAGFGVVGDTLGMLFDRWGGSEFTVKEPKPAGSMAARTTPTTAPVAAYYAPGAGGVQGAGGKAAPVTKTVNVNAGDTVINVNGAGDPAAVAQRVQTRNALSWDNVLNSAANTAGGL
jgi:hypothetical protein